MDVIKEGVDVEQFFTHFKGDFKGKSFALDCPPPPHHGNSRSGGQFSDFITTTISQWVSAWVLLAWEEIGRVSPPYLVLPLNEPSKPRLCHEQHYLNLWIKDIPFKLDHLCLTCHGMSCQGITEKPSMRKVVTSTFISTHRPVPFSACTGRVFTLHFVHYRFAGRLVLFSIRIWDLMFLVLHVRLVFHFPSTGLSLRAGGQGF